MTSANGSNHQLLIAATKDYCIVEKPVGITTHSPDSSRLGFQEWLEQKLACKLFTVHRLDKDTSGLILFAHTSKSAQKIAQAFANKLICKKYLLVTDRTLPNLIDSALNTTANQQSYELSISSYIYKQNNCFYSDQSQPANSCTNFRLVKIEHASDRFLYFWEAEPITGKPHQIRLHAKTAGIPILGDTLYGGTSFVRVMLHAYQLSWHAENMFVTSEPPLLFMHLAFCDHTNLALWLNSYDRRLMLNRGCQKTQNTTIRLIHSESANLRCDALGPALWFYWYKHDVPDAKELTAIKQFTNIIGFTKWKLKQMSKIGHNRSDLMETPQFPDRWLAQEHGLTYEFRSDCGQSAGLFLDQRQNRLWVHQNCSGKKVLNLFCYTGGFSLNAAKGNATEVVSVDISAKTLDWARTNFILNNIDPGTFEFWAADCQKFIKGCQKRQRKFDLIICDPPSFSRHPTIFRIEKDYAALIRNLLELLLPNGQLLFTTNYEKWSEQTFLLRIKQAVINHKCKILPMPQPDLDYELPGETPILKSILLQTTN